MDFDAAEIELIRIRDGIGKQQGREGMTGHGKRALDERRMEKGSAPGLDVLRLIEESVAPRIIWASSFR